MATDTTIMLMNPLHSCPLTYSPQRNFDKPITSLQAEGKKAITNMIRQRKWITCGDTLALAQSGV